MISNIELKHTIYMNKIFIQWSKYNNLDDVRYVLVKKKSSKPFFNYRDGIIVYDGDGLEYTDLNVKNGCIYYYRLFIFPNKDDEYNYITDNKCVFRCIAINTNEWLNYGDYLYKNIPRDFRLQDSQINLKDPSKNFPLKRFFNLCAYAFNKINTYDDLMLEQTDIENCDERYLPYHAKWLNCLYDERFGADINRLIQKTMEEAEPYIGTMVGLKYILQRIFKAEVEITSRNIESCVTNSGALISRNLYTNIQRGALKSISIKLHFDNSNQWLSNMQTVSSIMSIIRNYCALRTRFEMVFNVELVEKYDSGRISDYFLHDTIYEKIGDDYIKVTDDELHDHLIGSIDTSTYDTEKLDDEMLDSIVETESATYKQTDELQDFLYKQSESETIGNYSDDDSIVNIIRTRPVSLTCSQCTISGNLFTTDITY